MEPAAPATEAPKHVHVVSLTATNVKKIKAVRIEPDPKNPLVLIGGANDQGKSSVLDSILAVLGGKDASPEVPVRRGHKKGEVVLDLGELTARLRFTSAGGRELIIEDKDGNRMASPQAVMDRLTGKVGFDAEDFIRKDPKDQLSILRRIVGVDFAALDAKKKGLYDQRTATNASVKQLEAQIAAAPNPTDVPGELIDTTAVLLEIQKAQEHNKGREPLAEAYRNAASDLATRKSDEADCRKEETEIIAEIDRMEKALEAWRVKLKANSDEIVTSSKNTAESAKALETAEANGKAFIQQDVAPLQAKLAGADSANNKFRQAEARKGLVASLRTVEAKSQSLNNSIEEIDAEKERIMQEAKFPVKGLSFTEDGILFEGIPFAQASSSTKRRVSVAIGAALNPTLRVMTVKDGSLLDEKSMSQLRELAAEHNLQVWVEVVTSGPDARCAVIIEDGEVVGAPKIDDAPPAPDPLMSPVHPPKPTKKSADDLFAGLPNQ